MDTTVPTGDGRTLNAILAPYRKPILRRSLMQLVGSVLGFVVFWLAAFFALRIGYWATLLLSIPACGFMVRLFMIQHDCGHGSFFRSTAANDFVGNLSGILLLVPYAYWRRTHAIHHQTSGDLDHRDFGDIDTLTVREYRKCSLLQRWQYRLYRHPVVLLGIGPTYQFIFKHRLPMDIPWSWKREWHSVLLTNLGILAVLLVAWQTVGLRAFLMVQIPMTILAASLGIFLFYAQHQFEDTYWRENPDWDFHDAGIQGSSYMVLPKALQWFTASIGLHHIHHVSSKIPNYKLQQVYDENPEFRRVTRLSLWESVKCLRLALWDEDAGKLVSFRQAEQALHRPLAPAV